MVDAAEYEEHLVDGSATPALGKPNESRFDKTMQLDRVIAERNVSVPTSFGRYRVIERIGVGGFASVFSARDPGLDAPVAIKVLAENHSADTEVRKRFVAEARVARRLGGDRLIGVFDLGETDDGRPYVVMELASGGTLRARLNRIGRPSQASLLRLIHELGDCMRAVHDKGVVHRDIKPSNLLLRADEGAADRRPTELIEDYERLVLADFGLARDISGGASALTVGGGTAGYMAPEQADPKGKADVRADIYAATVVVAELTTGRHPERLDLPTANVSDLIRSVLVRGMAMNREDRPASAVEWSDDLLAAYRDDAPNGDPITPAATNPDQTRLIDATKVQAPHQFRDEADADYDETGLETSLPATPEHDANPATAAPASGADVGSTSPTRQLGNAALDGHSPSNGQAESELRLDVTETLPNDQLPDVKPRTFVRPVVDHEPPPPPPSIPLSKRAQRPAPGYESNEPVSPPASRTPAHRPLPAQPPPPQPAERIQRQVPRPGPHQGVPTPARPVPPAGPGRQVRPGSGQLPQTGAGGVPGRPQGQSVIRPAGPPPTKAQIKHQQRLARQLARRRRWRRRRRRFSNLIRALIRGVLAWLVMSVVATVVIAAASNNPIGNLSGGEEGLVNLVGVVSFFLGLRLFPWPRRLDPYG